MEYQELPEVDNQDADAKPGRLPFGHRRNSDSADGNSTGKWVAKKEGFGVSEPPGEPVAGADPIYEIDAEGDEDAEGEDEIDVNDDDDEYRADDGEEVDDDDGEFVPHKRTTSKNTHSLRPRSTTSRYSPYSTAYAQHASGKRASNSPVLSVSALSPDSTSELPQRPRKNARTLPIPVPVPNLTKKSRGRRVPTVNGVGGSSRGHRANEVALSARIYLCDVTGCGKCFARGEHLKRHIRSIHTYEKPHKCPYPGCGKEFSRHDNLGQHMRVHKDYPKILDKLGVGKV
ncbi:hypothetical protein BV22DRAFT_1013248 [Leucogyrophana mollusca]|uniref:Uncharacterized protein n=1 Tax=Leucogyrophana mollusca TaxID=85980 RepID=A0ACB8BG53_9AGAM|nr:hypothetical protein BV22DRAFT_1013248 [Leucogyrophana mollusca]